MKTILKLFAGWILEAQFCLGVVSRDEIIMNYSFEIEYPSPETLEFDKRVAAEIQTNWPAFYVQIESIVETHNANDILIATICSILDPKISDGDTSYRGILLKIKEKMHTDDTALKEMFLSLFKRSCTHEDIPLLLLTLASNRNLHCKVLAATGLARVGDAATLKEMQHILADLTAKEPERYAANKEAWEKALRIIDQRQDVVVPDLKPTYLDAIAKEIKKLEVRINAQASNSAPPLAVNTIPGTNKNQLSNTKPATSVFQSASSVRRIFFSVCMSLLFGGGIAWYLRNKKRA